MLKGDTGHTVTPVPTPHDAFGAALSRERKLLARNARRRPVMVLAVFALLVVVAAVTGLGRSLPGGPAFAGVWTGLVIALPLYFAHDYFTVTRPFTPIMELCGFSIASAHRGWASLDGNPEIATDPQEILRRIGDRSDGYATYLRARALMMQGDRASVRALLDGWKPGDPANRARQTRIMEQIAYEETGESDPSRVRAAVAAIPDEEERKAQFASVAIEEAMRAATRGEPVLEMLRAARLELGELDLSALHGREDPRLAERIDALGFVVSAAVAAVVLYYLSSL